MAGYPEIIIEFRSRGKARIERGLYGIVALVLQEQDTALHGVHYLYDFAETPEDLTPENQMAVQQAFYGNDRPPLEVYLVIEPVPEVPGFTVVGNPTMTTLENLTFDYLSVPFITEEETMELVTWAKSFNESAYENTRFMTVVANNDADHDQFINTTTPEHFRGEQVWTTTEYTPRIAGLCAGTTLRNSTTKAILNDLDHVTEFTRRELDDKIRNGEFVLDNTRRRGRNLVITTRGVTSLMTTTEDKGEVFKKIKVRSVLNMLYRDIYRGIEENYQGRYQNSYHNKLVLNNAIYAYLEAFEIDGVLSPGESLVTIHVEKQRNYLKSIGYMTNDERPVDLMSDEEVRRANTDSKVFIRIQARVLDTMEDFDILAEV